MPPRSRATSHHTVRGLPVCKPPPPSAPPRRRPAAAEFRGQAFNCSAGFGTPVLSALPSYLPANPALHPVNFVDRILGWPGADCTIDTNALLQYFSMNQPFWRLFVILLGYLGVLHVISYLALRVTALRERR
jgi:hypothetical protein